MSEHKPITGELRDTLERAECVFTNSAGFEQVNVTKVALDSMLDAIDAIHANLERENARLKAELEEDTKDWLSFDGEIARLRERTERLKAECDEAEHRGWTRGYDDGFASADDWMADHRDAMAEHGWVELPKDADGEYIRIGDVMEGVDKYDSLKNVTGKVITVSFESDGIVDVAIQAWNSDGKSWHRAYLDPDASVYRHYHAPTVEDVLREFAHVGIHIAAKHGIKAGEIDFYADEEAIAEYAAKLRLAGDAE